jgi:hypothetical protein
MTLIACFHPRGCRTLLADVLVSSPAKGSHQSDMVLPTRVYLGSNELNARQLEPAALRRKVIQINPGLVALWAGSYSEAELLARRSYDWFRERRTTEAELVIFLKKYYRDHIPNFAAIIVPHDEGWFYRMGNVRQSYSVFCGDYMAAGSGANVFMSMASAMTPRTDDVVAPDVDGLRIANDLMAREVVTGETLRSHFGASYEVLYRGPSGYERVDDVMHFFALAKVSSSFDNIEIQHYPHATRQWYEGDQLYVASFSTPDAERQGLGFQGFAIPSVLDEPREPIRTVESFANRPNYLCAHHIFDIAGKRYPSVLTMRGDAIDQHFTIAQRGNEIRIDHTVSYAALLHEQARKIARRPA